MVIHGPGGGREVPARAFHTGPYETVVGPAEMLTEIRLPIRPGSGSAYLKVMRRAGDWPIGAAGAAVWLADGLIADVGIGLTAVGAAHFVAAEAEEYLIGQPADEQVLVRAGEIAAEHCNPAADQRGPVEYKRHLAGELTTRVLRAAVSRARWQKPPSSRARDTAIPPGGTTPRTPRCPPPADDASRCQKPPETQ
jgi:carbon-monoxide dehydrogenase medium subunit